MSRSRREKAMMRRKRRLALITLFFIVTMVLSVVGYSMSQSTQTQAYDYYGDTRFVLQTDRWEYRYDGQEYEALFMPQEIIYSTADDFVLGQSVVFETDTIENASTVLLQGIDLGKFRAREQLSALGKTVRFAQGNTLSDCGNVSSGHTYVQFVSTNESAYGISELATNNGGSCVVVNVLDGQDAAKIADYLVYRAIGLVQ